MQDNSNVADPSQEEVYRLKIGWLFHRSEKYTVPLPRERNICLLSCEVSNGRDLVMRMPDVFVTSPHEAFTFKTTWRQLGYF